MDKLNDSQTLEKIYLVQKLLLLVILRNFYT